MELNVLIAEYIKEKGLSGTVEKFQEECKASGIALVPQPNHTVDTKFKVEELMVAFECGEHDAFIQLWSELVPQYILTNDPTCQDLELSLAVYFAVYPLKLKMDDGGTAMMKFKDYLDRRGAELSKLQSFTTYCALPYVPEPTLHPSFKHLFTESWKKELETRLQQFMKSSAPQLLSKPNEVKLEDLYHSYLSYTDKEAYLHQQLHEVQLNYQALAEVAIELVEALEATVAGKILNPDYIQQMCSRLFDASSGCQQHPTQDHSMFNGDESIDRPRSALQESVESLRQSISTPISHEYIQRYPHLDYPRLKHDLMVLPRDSKIILLKALRWRLTRSPPGPAREDAIRNFVVNDLLGFETSSETSESLLSFISCSDELVKEHFCRLLNSLSSLRAGRDYLQKSSDLNQSLCKLLTSIHNESPVLRNALGTVQKLSLRCVLQSSMITEGLLEWVVDLLCDTEGLSDYTLRYSLALLMNLCLRQEGKVRCIQISPKPLHILSELLEHENNEVRSYVNGILYSLLGVPELRTAAVKMDMQESLQSAMQVSPPDLQSQLKYVVTRLEEPFINDHDGDDTDEDGDEEEDPEVVDGEDEGDDDDIEPNSNGEEALRDYFIEAVVHGELPLGSFNVPLQRPITPSSLAQLRMSVNGVRTAMGRPTTAHGAAPLSPIKDQLSRPKTN